MCGNEAARRGGLITVYGRRPGARRQLHLLQPHRRWATRRRMLTRCCREHNAPLMRPSYDHTCTRQIVVQTSRCRWQSRPREGRSFAVRWPKPWLVETKKLSLGHQPRSQGQLAALGKGPRGWPDPLHRKGQRKPIAGQRTWIGPTNTAHQQHRDAPAAGSPPRCPRAAPDPLLLGGMRWQRSAGPSADTPRCRGMAEPVAPFIPASRAPTCCSNITLPWQRVCSARGALCDHGAGSPGLAVLVHDGEEGQGTRTLQWQQMETLLLLGGRWKKKGDKLKHRRGRGKGDRNPRHKH